STKKNLFITVIKNVLEKKFASTVMEYAKEEDTEKFLAAIINNRLDVLSKHKDLIKMLISESVRGNLTDDINFPVIIFTSLQAGLDAHFEMMGRQVDTEHLARAISGMLLSYILFPHETAFHELSEAEKNSLAQKHAQLIVAMILPELLGNTCLIPIQIVKNRNEIWRDRIEQTTFVFAPDHRSLQRLDECLCESK